MDVVWDADGVTVRAISDALNERVERPRAYTTYLTICQRLDGKGLVLREREGKADVYRPAISREAYADARVGAEVEALVARFGDGALVHFVREADRLDPQRREQLRRLARS
jgi:predicted transcriptional regulator